MIPVVEVGGIAALHAEPEKAIGGAPIVFVHGAGGGKSQFRHWQRYCAANGWESYAIDLRGPNEASAGVQEAPSIMEYAAEIERAIAAVGPCYLVGHSMGGLAVQIVASRSNLVLKTVLVATSPPGGMIAINAFTIAMIKYLPAVLMGKPFVLSAEDRQRFITNRLPPSPQKAFQESPAAARNILFQKVRIGALRCPVLVMTAELDRAVPRSVGPRLARRYHGDCVEIPGMAHMLMLEPEWEVPIRKILDWIAAPAGR